MLDVRQLGDLLMTARDGGSVFRFEGLRSYIADSDGEDYRRYVDGLPGPSMTRKQGWLDLLRNEAARGVHWHRVRLIQRPVSDYERYACEWGYAYNTAAGDDCRILDPGLRATPPDFWLVDNEKVALMHYGHDGHYLGADLITEGAEVKRYVEIRDALWNEAEPFYSWWDRHLEYHRQMRAA